MAKTDLFTKYTNILHQNHYPTPFTISDIVTNKSADLIGEHYCSAVEFIRISFEDSSALKDELNLFVKKIVQSEDKTQQVIYKEMFLKESNFLGKILKSLLELCVQRKANSIGLEKYFARCYYVDDSEIVMEDLVKQGFLMIKKADRQDFDQARSVMEGLGKLHGVSYALIQTTSGGAKTILEQMPMLSEIYFKPAIKEQYGPMFMNTFKVIMQILEDIDTESSKDTLKFFHDGCENSDLFDTMIKPLKEKTLYEVIVHGDCWINNMMLRGNGSHPEVKFIDFQLSKLSSPATDLTYYMYTSLKQEVLEQWVQLYQIYFDTFLETLSALGDTFPYKFDDLLKEVVKISKFGLMIGIFQVVMASVDAEKSIDEFSANIHKVTNNSERVKGLATSVTGMVNHFKTMQSYIANLSP